MKMKTIKRLLKSNIWKILLIAILLTSVVSAKADVTVSLGEDFVKFTVKNTGSSPIYILNVLTVLDSKGKVVYTSGDISTADVLKLNPGISYTFIWDTLGATIDIYSGKLYIGNDKKYLISTYANSFNIPEKSDDVHFYTDKSSYKYGESVDITLSNDGSSVVYVPNIYNTKWEIVDKSGKTIVHIPPGYCEGYGYGECKPDYYELKHNEKLEQIWNQKDDSGEQVKPGTYNARAVYSFDSSDLDKIKISTKPFVIKK